MSKVFYSVSLEDGSVEPQPAPSKIEKCAWKESVMEHVLTLNPALLGVESELPLGLDGGSTAQLPDQVYVDELGRITVVEVKNEEAGMDAVAQLLSYAHHWSILPIGEMSPSVAVYTASGVAKGIFGASLAAVRDWAARTVSEPSARQLQSFGASVLARYSPGWVDAQARSALEYGKKVWGDHALTVPGAPARMVLVAPRFSDEARAFVQTLNERSVALELVEAELFLGAKKGSVFLRWETVEQCDYHTPIWNAARRIWRSATFRERFAFNAWADMTNRGSFSFSAREAPAVKIWLGVNEDGSNDLSTCVPDRWYEGSARRKLREQLLAALPEGFERDRWLSWTFARSSKKNALEKCADGIAVVLHEVLVPHADKV